MDLDKNKIPGVDVSDQSPGLIPESIDDDGLEYDDASFDGVEIEYTTQT